MSRKESLQLVVNNYDGYSLFLIGSEWEGNRWFMEFDNFQDVEYAKEAWEELLYGPKPKKRYEVSFKFLPAPDGSTYELQHAKLTVRAPSENRAWWMGIEWLDGKWAHYEYTTKDLE